MTQKKLTRSFNNRKIAGVCGGLGEYFNIDPLIFRIIFLFLLLGGGTGFFLYLIFWFLMPENRAYDINAPHTTYQESDIEDVNINSPDQKFMKKNTGFFWGLLLVALGLLWLGRSFGFFHFYWFNLLRLWPLLLISLGVSFLPIERVWKNVCNFILLVFAIVLLFVLPASSCHEHFWDDDWKYEIKRKFRNSECTTREYSKSELIQKEILITEEIKGVIIEGPWEVTITQEDTQNSAMIEYNLPESKVKTEINSNGYLHLRALGNKYRHKTLRATINAALLEKIQASGAANINTHGHFSSCSNIRLSGASILNGFSCEGDETNLSLSGASKLKNFSFDGTCIHVDVSGASKIDFLKMNVNRFKVNASGASHIKGNGLATETSITGSGSSHFNILDFESELLDINLSGASSVEITVNQTIKGTLTGASTLKYKNAENVRGVSTSGGSKIISVK